MKKIINLMSVWFLILLLFAILTTILDTLTKQETPFWVSFIIGIAATTYVYTKKE